MERNTHISVYVRIRPESHAERSSFMSSTPKKQFMKRNIVKPVDDQMLLFDPSSPDSSEIQRFQGTRNGSGKDLQFVFDRVFHKDSTQLEVYEHTTKSILDDVLSGYNCTVFAYGQTGSGKTHTMQGSDSSGPGVLILTVIDLFAMIERLKKERDVRVVVSYLEIYNEQIRDLLRIKKKGDEKPVNLMLLQDNNRGVRVSGLSEYQPRTAQEVLDLLKRGNENRMQAGTAANAVSSRSHAVFQIVVESRERTDTGAEVRIGKLSLIDLAGSERASETKNRDMRLTEGGNINKSLLALANCINALAKNTKPTYVPYRNSKLTRLLSDSLNGNCRSCMIACISPSSLCYEDTYNTLKYASRTRNIKTKLVKNVHHVNVHIGKYKQLIKDLQSQIKEQTREINELKQMNSRSREEEDALKEKERMKVDRILKELQRTQIEEIHLRRRMLELQDAQRKNQLEIHRKINKIRAWERSHSGKDPGILITTLKSDIETNSDLIKEYDLQKQKIQQSILKCIQHCKSLTESLPSIVHNTSLRLNVEHEIQKHSLNISNLDLESMLQHAESENMRTMLLLEESQHTSAHISNVMKALFDQIQRTGGCPSSLERQYRIAKQWLDDTSQLDRDKLLMGIESVSSKTAAFEGLPTLLHDNYVAPNNSFPEPMQISQNHSLQKLSTSTQNKKQIEKESFEDAMDTSMSEDELQPAALLIKDNRNTIGSSKLRASREAWTSKSKLQKPFSSETDILKQKFAELENQLRSKESSESKKGRILTKRRKKEVTTPTIPANLPNYMISTASHRNRFGSIRPATATVSVSLANLDTSSSWQSLSNKENLKYNRLVKTRSQRQM